MENNNWVADQCLSNVKQFEDKMFLRLIMGWFNIKVYEKRKELKGIHNMKWAWIKIGNTHKLCFVDNKTLKAYKSENYSFTWMEIPRFKFLRWATTFDL